MKIKRIIALVLALMCVCTSSLAADVVTEYEKPEIASAETALQSAAYENSRTDEVMMLSEAVSRLSITSPRSTIVTAGGKLQLTCNIESPLEEESVIWSVEVGQAYATIDQTGLVTALANGVVVCKARSTVDSSQVAYKTITIAIQADKHYYVDLGMQNCYIHRLVEGVYRNLGGMGYYMQFPAGTEFVLKAVPKNGYEFLYWKDGNSRIVSYDPEMTFALGSKMKFTAVCAPISSANVLITFKDISGVILAEGYSNVDIKVPAEPYSPGYEFKYWIADGDKYDLVPRAVLDTSAINENTMFMAGYSKEETTYTVTVTGGNTAGGEYRYNTRVTVVAAEPEQGKKFAYWLRDGKIVCYEPEYKFYVGSYDTNLEAVYNDDNEVTMEVPVIVMHDVKVVGGNKLSFVSERNLPDEYTLVSTGIILSNTEGDITLETTGTLIATATSKDKNGQLMVRKKDVSYSERWYGRAYLVYKDGDNLITAYSNIVSRSLSD